jgi:hypothetical protein
MPPMAPSIVAPGGPFSGRGGLKTGFNHLLFAPEAYQRYLEAHREGIEDFQGGPDISNSTCSPT